MLRTIRTCCGFAPHAPVHRLPLYRIPPCRISACWVGFRWFGPFTGSYTCTRICSPVIPHYTGFHFYTPAMHATTDTTHAPPRRHVTYNPFTHATYHGLLPGYSSACLHTSTHLPDFLLLPYSPRLVSSTAFCHTTCYWVLGMRHAYNLTYACLCVSFTFLVLLYHYHSLDVTPFYHTHTHTFLFCFLVFLPLIPATIPTTSLLPVPVLFYFHAGFWFLFYTFFAFSGTLFFLLPLHRHTQFKNLNSTYLLPFTCTFWHALCKTGCKETFCKEGAGLGTFSIPSIFLPSACCLQKDMILSINIINI